jgi:hypothetical protein
MFLWAPLFEKPISSLFQPQQSPQPQRMCSKPSFERSGQVLTLQYGWRSPTCWRNEEGAVGGPGKAPEEGGHVLVLEHMVLGRGGLRNGHRMPRFRSLCV